jgi:hypothetical protein
LESMAAQLKHKADSDSNNSHSWDRGRGAEEKCRDKGIRVWEHQGQGRKVKK